MFRFSPVLLLCASLHVSFAFSSEEEDMAPILPIMAGNPAQPGDFPFLASILFKGKTICSGAIISKKFVITTAGCCRAFIRFLSVRVGTTSLNVGGVLKKVLKKHLHPQWNKKPVVHDICLLQLSTLLQYSNNIQKANLPTGENIFSPGTKTVAIGHGFWWPYLRTLMAKDKQVYFESSIADYETCAPETYSYKNGKNKNSVVCTEAGSFGIEPCKRLRGVPLVTKSDTVLIGLFARGQARCFATQKNDGEEAKGEELEERERKPATFVNIVVNRSFIKKIANV